MVKHLIFFFYQKVGRISILEAVQEQTENRSEQRDLTGPTLIKRVGLEVPFS